MDTFEILDKKPVNWDSLVTHPLQSWEWGEFRSSMGVEVIRMGVFDTVHRKEIVDGLQLTFHKIPHSPFTIGYFPKGKMPTPSMIFALKKLGLKKRTIYIQFEPNIEGDQSNIQGLSPSHHPLFTRHNFVLDLRKSEDQLLKDMHSKTRYNIKVAQKHAVHVQEDSSEKGFEEYLRLSEETTKRQGFYAHTPRYHKKLWTTLHKVGIAKLWTATYNNETLAAWIIFCFRDTIYYPYGASSRNHREVMAPNLLLWEIALWAKKNKFQKFDLWGALGPIPDQLDPWYGFHRFKQGFNPELVQYIGSYDLILSPVLYRLYSLADTLRWKILKFRR